MTLREAAQLALDAHIALREWINAVPQDTRLPSMPGIDGDWLDDVEHQLRQALAEPEQPARVPLTQAMAEELAHRRCRRYIMIDTEAPYQFDGHTLMYFVADIEKATIKESLTVESNSARVPFLPGEYETLTERGAMAWAGYDAEDDGK